MTITDLKTSLAITKVLAHYGQTPNRNHLLHCPFHEDKTPSLQIFPKSNTFCCFSTNCTAGTGDQIQYVELMETKLGRATGTSKARKHHAILTAKEIYGYKEETLDDVFFKLRSKFKRSKKAQDYLKSRHLEGIEAGYNAGSYGELKHCIIFPLKNELDKIVGLYGRSIYDNNKQRHFYQKGKTKGLYPSYPKPTTRKIILAESIIDAATLVKHGNLQEDTFVLAMYGTQGFGEEHERAIKSLPRLEEITFCFDGDEGGRKAVEKYFYSLQNLLSN